MLAAIPAATLVGIDGRAVTVEVHVSNGLPGFTIVGLPDAACREAHDRVRAALLSSALPWPVRRVTVNLAPSGVRKAGSGLDLAIAMGLLVAQGEVSAEAVADIGFVGELGLDGAVRHVRGMLPLVAAVGAGTVVVPAAGSAEATGALGRAVRAVGSLATLVAALRKEAPWPDPPPPAPAPPPAPIPDLAEIRGQAVARRALEIAAAGAHHVLFVGPPGAGKTMLAARLPGLLPPLDDARALETTRAHSVGGLPIPTGGLVRTAPFRAPHHGASFAALVGGGSGALRPGEITYAHNGVLFLDELGEFSPAVLDSLRQPLEEGVVRIARASASVTFPARFLLVAATNPCPCGEGGAPGACACSDGDRSRYLRRLSGPLLDRFDLRVAVRRPAVAELLDGVAGEPSADVAARVAAARRLAHRRGVDANRALGADALERAAPLAPGARRLLERALGTGRLTARGLHRIRSVALTVADLEGGADELSEAHVATAMGLRAAMSFGARRAA